LSKPSYVFDVPNNDFKSHEKLVCLSVVTQDRFKSAAGKAVNHLNKAAMSILTRTKLRHRNNLAIVLFSTQPAGRGHNSSNLNQLADLFRIRTVNLSSIVTSYTNARDKEALDYAFVLRETSKMNCSYVMVSEDDAIVKKDWFEILESVLNRAAKHKTDFFIIKFFTGYKLIDIDWLAYPSCVLTVIVYSAILTVVLMKVFFKKKSSIITAVLITISSVAVIFLLKSLSVSPVKSDDIYEYKTGFSTVSILYQNDKRLAEWIDFVENTIGSYLNNTSEFRMPKDLLLEKFLLDNKYKEFILEPSLVQHIGMQSSLEYRDLNEAKFRRMFKSYSFMDDYKLLKFDQNYLLK
jgi:hypothetical protein